MALTKKTGISGLTSRKEIRKILTAQLENALIDLKKELGEEKFQLRLKKAVKALTKDFGGAKTSDEVTVVDAEPIAEKIPSKAKKVAAKKTAIKKSAKKKAVKAQHPDTPSK